MCVCKNQICKASIQKQVLATAFKRLVRVTLGQSRCAKSLYKTVASYGNDADETLISFDHPWTIFRFFNRPWN